MLAYSIHLLFVAYTVMLFVRVVGSWFPQFAHTKFLRFIAHYVDPYLQLFRKIIPPIGGVLDLSPLLAFFVLNLLDRLLISLVL